MSISTSIDVDHQPHSVMGEDTFQSLDLDGNSSAPPAASEYSGRSFPKFRDRFSSSASGDTPSSSKSASKGAKNVSANLERERLINFTPDVALGGIATDGTTYPVDIVAIHGLNGDNRKTWEIEGVNWLQDFLPQDLPGARVFSYGYNADVYTFGSSKGGPRYISCSW